MPFSLKDRNLSGNKWKKTRNIEDIKYKLKSLFQIVKSIQNQMKWNIIGVNWDQIKWNILEKIKWNIIEENQNLEQNLLEMFKDSCVNTFIMRIWQWHSFKRILLLPHGRLLVFLFAFVLVDCRDVEIVGFYNKCVIKNEHLQTRIRSKSIHFTYFHFWHFYLSSIHSFLCFRKIICCKPKRPHELSYLETLWTPPCLPLGPHDPRCPSNRWPLVANPFAI